MKVIFSRKGFDSGAGGVPSPIVNGRPISIPIPTSRRSTTTYGQLGLGELVSQISNSRYTEDSLCHHDPMFEAARCAFGQTGAAQSHLTNNSVGIGDVFLFFGLFSKVNGADRHHRIFGYLQVEDTFRLGAIPNRADQPSGFTKQHPHTIGEWNDNNTIYVGPGTTVRSTKPGLRLSVPGGRVSVWRVPSWLSKTGLTYHGSKDRWGDDTLEVVSRGQEFITDISGNTKAQKWLEDVLTRIKGN